MDQLRTLLSRIAALFGRQRLDADLEEELRTHIDLATAENMTLGMSRRQARTKALREFGGITQTRETYRAHRGFPFLEQIGRDLRFGLRQLSRAPGFTLTAVLTLALGLGANTAIFSLINGLLLRPLPVPHAEQLAILMNSNSASQTSNEMFSGPMFRALEKRHEAFQDVAAYWSNRYQVRGSLGSIEVEGALVSGQYFRALQTPALIGRYLTSQDDQPGNSNGSSVVISYAFWTQWFNRSPNVIGSKLILSSTAFTVIGVMPQSFIGAEANFRPSVYIPLSSEPIVNAPVKMLTSEGIMWLRILGRRNPGVSLEQANAALRAATDPILNESLTDASELKNFRKIHFQLAAEPGSTGLSYLRSTFQKPLLVVFSLCAAMLLLACLNLASLLMARAAARERELATRLAIGASRRRLVQQLLMESLLIAVLGTTAGLAVTPIASRALVAFLIHGSHNVFIDTSLDFRVFLFAALATVFAAILIGLIPALRATSGDLTQQISNGSYARTTHRRRGLLPRLLMSSEVALALILVVGAGLLATSLTRLYRTGLGFDPKGVVQFELNMRKQPVQGEALQRLYQEFGDALSRRPGVSSVSFASAPPLSGDIEIDTLATPFSNGGQAIHINVIAPRYFATMRIPLLNGRDFNWQDTQSSGVKVILNQSAAKALFPGRNAIGQLLPMETYEAKSKPFEVIAVVGDTRFRSVRQPAPPVAYLAMTQSKSEHPYYAALIRLNGQDAKNGIPPSFAVAARNLVTRMAPEAPAPTLASLSTQFDNSLTTERMMAMLAVFFAISALLVTGIGLYGTLAYATARRTSEIGIRMALGAQRIQVVVLIFRENAWTAVCGCVAGLVAALFASRLLASFLYGTSVRDPWVLAASVTGLLAIASAASLLPAVRAARIEPMQALKSE
ncbi:MAG TPA: ABC transporter permease [Acidobacteriaceae bacterium]|nr:ABC transporter permease [Acidobacteriaceae bacterium]